MYKTQIKHSFCVAKQKYLFNLCGRGGRQSLVHGQLVRLMAANVSSHSNYNNNKSNNANNNNNITLCSTTESGQWIRERYRNGPTHANAAKICTRDAQISNTFIHMRLSVCVCVAVCVSLCVCARYCEWWAPVVPRLRAL